ncbi:MAG: hypothetical protein SNJ69_15795 [Chloroflexaceae bacterium]
MRRKREQVPIESNYARYRAAEFNRSEDYPIAQSLDPVCFRPLGTWMGRLILPAIHDRALVRGTWLEVRHAPEAHRALVGTRVRLRWMSTIDLNARLWGASRTVVLDEGAWEAVEKGIVVGERLHGLTSVNPLESLAGAHPYDDVLVRLEGAVEVDLTPRDGGAPIVAVSRMPVEISAPFYALARFLGPGDAPDTYRVAHYQAAAGEFSSPEDLVYIPEVIPDMNDTRNFTVAGIERSPCNEQGWYLYGAQDQQGRFVVRAVAARQVLRLDPRSVVVGTGEVMDFLRPRQWRRAAVKGQATQTLLVPDGMHPDAARAEWHEGDQALLIHIFGGIGGKKTEPAARTPLYWGHVAFGIATVMREPLADELSFDIVYHQIYAHNADGLIAGALHYSRYSGDRQFGWAGIRPIQDLLVKIDALSGAFSIFGVEVTALEQIRKFLEVMEARYRIADGRGATFVGALNNCAQDSAQALFVAVREVGRILGARADVHTEMTDTPEEARRLEALQTLGEEIRRVLLPWGSARSDWEYEASVLGGGGSGLLGAIGDVMKSWRTMLPPVMARALAEVFIEQGATIYALRTYQVGGDDPDVEPIVPNV